MPNQSYNTLILSHATYVGASGATAGATFSFFSSDYKPPTQERSFETDVVHNQNGKFKYLYDNGPGFKKFSPFSINCEKQFAAILAATATQQYDHIREMWDHPGTLQLRAPDGIYTVHWAESLDQSFRVFPMGTATAPEYQVVVQFDEAQ